MPQRKAVISMNRGLVIAACIIAAMVVGAPMLSAWYFQDTEVTQEEADEYFAPDDGFPGEEGQAVPADQLP